jgi:hypothetical protein
MFKRRLSTPGFFALAKAPVKGGTQPPPTGNNEHINELADFIVERP